MRRRVKFVWSKFWRHCTSPITVRSLIFVGIIVWFIWMLFDKWKYEAEISASLANVEASTQDTKEGIRQIHLLWQDFNRDRAQMLENQMAIQQEIQAQSKLFTEQNRVLQMERKIRERLARKLSRPIPKRKRVPTRAPSSQLRHCTKEGEVSTTFGNGATVKEKVLILVPCQE